MGETNPFLPSKTNPWISDGWLILHVWPIFYQAVYSIAIELVFDLVTTVKSVLWCSGYHVCFTRRRSRVRASPEPPFLHVSTLARHYARTNSYTRYLRHPFFGMQLGWQSHTPLPVGFGTFLTLYCMLCTQMDKITYPPLWRHSWKPVLDRDIVARPKWKKREFPTICFQSQLSSIIFTDFMAFWSWTKIYFFCNFLKLSMQ